MNKPHEAGIPQGSTDDRALIELGKVVTQLTKRNGGRDVA